MLHRVLQRTHRRHDIGDERLLLAAMPEILGKRSREGILVRQQDVDGAPQAVLADLGGDRKLRGKSSALLLKHIQHAVFKIDPRILPMRFPDTNPDRKILVYGQSVSVRVDPGGRRVLNKTTPT